ncbi:MAG TPA: creatininase family protein [Rhizobium sp.]
MALSDGLLFQDLTREEIRQAREGGALVAVPIGAIEQHGAHLPVGTDARLSAAVSLLAARRTKGPRVLVAPLLPYGFSPHHISHPGTVSIRLSTYLSLLEDIARSLLDTGFRRIVFVNGHGGNSAPLRSKVAEMVTDGIPVTGVDYWVPSDQTWIAMLKGELKRFGHACEFETSLMMALEEGETPLRSRIRARISGLEPRILQPWVIPGETTDAISDARAAWPPIFQGDDRGYHGDPAAATVENGIAILEVLADRLAGFYDAFAAMPIRLGRSAHLDERSVSLPLINKRNSIEGLQ